MIRAARAIVLAMALIAASAGAWLYVSLWVPVGGGRAVTRFTVPPGASARLVARELKETGLIRSAPAFRLAAYRSQGWQRVRAGDYALRRDMSALQILRSLESGKVMTQWITVPEGFDIWQLANLVQAKGLGSAEDFLWMVRSGDGFRAGFPLPANGLEGYLFPDTYRVGVDAEAPHKLVQMMLARFDEVVWQGLLGGHVSPASLREAVTMASLVEGEAKVDAERPLIAGVLYNRLRKGMKLECDATVQYALGPGNHKQRLGFPDLAVASEYNTYLHAGLPPGPINNPGRASIAAALRPVQTPYLFYVARSDGSHVFSRTYAEHLRAVAQVRAQRRAQGTP